MDSELFDDHRFTADYGSNSTMFEESDDVHAYAKLLLFGVFCFWLLTIGIVLAFLTPRLQTHEDTTSPQVRMEERKQQLERVLIMKSIVVPVCDKAHDDNTEIGTNDNSGNKHNGKLTKNKSNLLLDEDSSLARGDSQLICPICLSEYENGQEICWSKNAECEHVFHRSCIEPWLMKHNRCPCCRCNYLAELSSSQNNEADSSTPSQHETNDRCPSQLMSSSSMFSAGKIMHSTFSYIHHFGRTIRVGEPTNAGSEAPRQDGTRDIETGDTS